MGRKMSSYSRNVIGKLFKITNSQCPFANGFTPAKIAPSAQGYTKPPHLL